MSEPRTTGFVLTASRSLGVAMRRARETSKQALASQGCTLEVDAITQITGGRGSQWRIGFDNDDLPLLVTIDLDEIAGTERVELRLRIIDRWWSPIGSPLGVRDAYQHVFLEILAALDEAWRAIDPDAPAFPAPSFQAPGLPSKIIQDTAKSYEQARTWVLNRADNLLGGRRDAPPVPAVAGLQSVQIAFPEGVEVQLSADELAEMLGVAALIARQLGDLSDSELDHVEQLAARLEDAIEKAPRFSQQMRVPLLARDRPIFDLLRAQAHIRTELPVRRLMTCLACRTEQIINDDYQRLLERNRRLRLIMANLGTLLSEASSTFAVAGTAYRFNKDDPNFVCTACQGLRAQSRMITYCPECGARQDQGLLRSCGCGHDFTAGVAEELAALDAGRAAASRPVATPQLPGAAAGQQSPALPDPMGYLSAGSQAGPAAAGPVSPAPGQPVPLGTYPQPALAAGLPQAEVPNPPGLQPLGPQPPSTRPPATQPPGAERPASTGASPRQPVPSFGPRHELRGLFWWRSGGLFQDNEVVPTLLIVHRARVQLISDLPGPAGHIELPTQGLRLRGRSFEAIFTLMAQRRIELLSRPVSASPVPGAGLLAELTECGLLPNPDAFAGVLRSGQLGRLIVWRGPDEPWQPLRFDSDEARVSWFTGLLVAAGALRESAF